jgi:hypothetical protein
MESAHSYPKLPPTLELKGEKYLKYKAYNTQYYSDYDPIATFEDLHPQSKDIPEKRSGFSSIVAGKYFYVIGGVNEEGNMIDDFWKFNLGTFLNFAPLK